MEMVIIKYFHFVTDIVMNLDFWSYKGFSDKTVWNKLIIEYKDIS